MSFVSQVNEYLKDVVAQDQRKRETESAEPAGSPRVGASLFPSTSTQIHTDVTSLMDT